MHHADCSLTPITVNGGDKPSTDHTAGVRTIGSRLGARIAVSTLLVRLASSSHNQYPIVLEALKQPLHIRLPGCPSADMLAESLVDESSVVLVENEVKQ